MAEFAKPSENTKPKLPPPAEQAAGDYERDATIVSEMTAAGVLSIIAGKTLQNAVRAPGYKVYRDRVLKASGDPSDPLEAMMLEQATVAHYQVLNLQADAARAETPEMIEVLNAAAAKLMAEFRRTSMALREYRTPVIAKSITVVRQQNLAGGDQQIALIDKRLSVPTQNIETTADTTNQNKAITHEVTPIFASPVPGLTSAPTESLQRAGRSACRGPGT